MARRSVTLLVPVFNEEDVLPIFYQEIGRTIATHPDYAFEILFVDDGSSDGTRSAVENLAAADTRISYVSLSRNFGKERAMLAGLDRVTTDAVIIIDVDLQDPPSLIGEMLVGWEEGYDDVYARRRSRTTDTAMKRATSKLYYRLLKRITRVEIQENAGDFRLLDRKCIDALVRFRESDRNTKGLFSWIGFRKKEVLFDRPARAAGKTKWNYVGLVNLAIDGITSFTTAPLRVATFAGMIISFASFVYLAVILIQTWVTGIQIEGYASTLTVILFLGGVQLLALGVIGEYVGRIFNETKARPPYLVQSEHRGAAS